jgi:ParB family transcriptional regulator, chromosome partitioning protein
LSLADKRRPALGRGMAALLANAPAPPPAAPASAAPASAVPVSGRALLSLPIEAIERSPEQPRKRFDEARLEELAASIREHGIVEPILVRKHGGRYRIVAGERRWRAAQRAGLAEVPALVREASDREAFEIALVENVQRADLNAIEEAEAYQALVTDHGLTQEGVAKRVGKERSTVANALRLLKLPEDVRDGVRDGRLEMGHARALLGLDAADAIRRAAARVLREHLTVRATEALVRELAGEPKKKVDREDSGADSPSVRAVVNRLQRRLGCRARVVPKTTSAGRLELEYTSLEELDGILAKIGA